MCTTGVFSQFLEIDGVNKIFFLGIMIIRILFLFFVSNANLSTSVEKNSDLFVSLVKKKKLVQVAKLVALWSHF